MMKLDKLIQECSSDIEFKNRYAAALTENLQPKGFISKESARQIIEDAIEIGIYYERTRKK